MNVRLFRCQLLTKAFACLARVGLPLLVVVMTGGLAACGVAGGSAGEWKRGAVEDARMVSDVPQQVRVLFYREVGAVPQIQVPVNLYIDGHYQASLLGGGYTEQVLCAGEHEFTARFSGGYRHGVGRGWTQAFRIDAAPIRYFRLIEGAADAVRVVAVEPEVAARVVPSLHLQTQTLSRVVSKGCSAR